MVRGNIGKHCKDAHDSPSKSLKLNMEPSDPRYENWKDFIENPAKVVPYSLPDCTKIPTEIEISQMIKYSQSQPISEIDIQDMVESPVDKIQSAKSQNILKSGITKQITKRRVQRRDMCKNPILIPRNGVFKKEDIK